MSEPRHAALPMYDLPELRPATDALWEAVAQRLRDAGVGGVPGALDRSLHPTDGWRRPELLLGQTCGYPLVTALRDRVRVVATPTYRAPGCGGGTYASAVVVRATDERGELSALRGARAAINGRDSHSGMSALRAQVAPLARRGRFFARVIETGSHRASLRAVREGAVDVAAIDGLTLALIGDAAPAERAGLRILGWTAPAPAPPFVTSHATPDDELAQLRYALADAVADPSLAPVTSQLRIAGVRAATLEDYAEVTRLETEAREAGYPTLT